MQWSGLRWATFMADIVPFPKSRTSPSTKNVLGTILFTVFNADGRPLTCSAHEVESDVELRLAYADNEVMRSQRFNGIDSDEGLLEMARAWRRLLIEKGFTALDD
jgi:hypothetical protein